MAEVYGDFGGQPIQLNNAATEATLKEILAALLKAGVAGKGGKAQKDLEKKLTDLAKATEELTDKQKEALKQAKEAEKKKEEEIKQAAELGKALNGLLSNVLSVVSGMANIMSTLSRLDNSMTAAASSMSMIPIVGGTLATVFGAVAGAAERTYKAFQVAASVGANFGGSITEMVRSASAAGLTFDQFSGIVSRTGSDLALLGGSTAEGAKRLAELGKEIRKPGGVGKELAALGYTTEQINEGMAKYGGMLSRTGALQGMSNTQLVNQTAQYLTNLDAVSKLTGQNKKDLEDQRAQMVRDAQIRNTLRKLDATSQEELMSFLQTLPEEMREGAKEVIATGTATSDAGKAYLQYMNQSGSELIAMNQQIRNTGKFTKENNQQLQRTVQREVKNLANTDLAENMRLFGDKAAQGFFGAVDEVAARDKTLAQIQKEQQDAAAERLRKEQLGIKEVDPQTLKNFQEKIANISNQFSALLMNSGLLDTFMSTFDLLVKFISNTVVPAFTWLGNNIGLVAAVLGPLVGIVGLVNIAFALLEFQSKLTAISTGMANGALTRLATAAFAPLAPLLALAKGAFIASLPFLKIAAPVIALAILFKKLYEGGWTFSDVLEAIGDNFKRLMITVADGFLWVLDKVTFGDANKKIKQAQQVLDLERKELDDKEKARDQRRREKREERGIKEEENKVTKEGIDLQRQENDQRKKTEAAANAPQNAYDLSTPQKMFESAMRRQQGVASGAATQPGATAASPGLGAMAARFESGAAGSSAVGWDSTGGTSYGKYQIASKTGTMAKFMEHLKATNPEAYARLSAAGPADAGKDGKFAQEWKKLAGEGKLAGSEHEFIKKTHYDVGAAGLQNKSLQDMLGKSKALQEVMWSTSVQHGGGGASGIFNKVFKEGMTEADLIKAIYAERGTRFGSSTAQVRSSVQNRFAQEQQLALGMVGEPGTATPSATAAQTAVAQAPVTTTPRPTTTPVQAAQAPTTTQETPSSLLASLNNKMDTLIALNKRANDTRESQLRTAKSSAGEVTVYAA